MSIRHMQKTFLTGASLLTAGLLISACGPIEISSGGNDKSDSSSSKPHTSNSSDADPSSSDKSKGKVMGTVKYLAPGKYTVTTAKNDTQAFYLTKDAKITGWGTICGEPNQRTTCTKKQLKSSTQTKKVIARVRLNDGKASAVTEHKPGTAGDTH